MGLFGVIYLLNYSDSLNHLGNPLKDQPQLYLEKKQEYTRHSAARLCHCTFIFLAFYFMHLTKYVSINFNPISCIYFIGFPFTCLPIYLLSPLLLFLCLVSPLLIFLSNDFLFYCFSLYWFPTLLVFSFMAFPITGFSLKFNGNPLY